MKECKIITKLVITQFPGILDLSFLKKGKRGSLLFKILLPLFVLFLLLVSFSYSYGIGMALKQYGKLEVLTDLAAVITAAVIFFTTIYKIRGIIFDFKDFDLLMSLPLKYTTVIISRLVLLYLINLPAALIIMVSAGTAYSLLGEWDITAFLLNLAAVLFLPMIPVAAAAAAGILIAFISSRFRHSKAVNIILTFGILIGFMSISIGAGEKGDGRTFALAIEGIVRMYPPARIYHSAVWNRNWLEMIFFLLLSLGSFGALSLAAGIKFKYLNTFLLKKASSKAYRAGKERRGTPFLALYEKELKRYFSSVIYVVNTGFGMVLLTIFSFAVLFVSQDKIDGLLGMEGSVNLLKDYLPEIVSFCVSMTCISASSISLEGKNIWLLKSLPLPAKKIFHSKIAVNLTMTVPFAVADGILLSLGFKLSYGEIASILLFPVSVSIYTSIAGIDFNLLFPKLDWTTEVAVIKQSVAVVVTMFSGMAVSFLPAAVSLLLSAASGSAIYLVSAALVLTVSGLLYGLLMKNGEKKYFSRI